MTATTKTKKFFTINGSKTNLDEGVIKDMLNDCLNMENAQFASMLTGNYTYSVLNLLLCRMQLKFQGYNMGVIKCLSKWTAENRYKKQGAVKLWMRLPVVHKVYKDGKVELDADGKEKTYKTFKFANNWLAYDQTIGANDDTIENKLAKINIDVKKLAKNLGITLIDYDYSAQNCGGYAIVDEKKLAINPAWADSYEMASVLFHEIGHIVCKHKGTDNTQIKEIEAEGVALIMGKLLGIGNESSAAAYIQNWSRKNSKLITDKVASHILSAVNEIVKANNKE